jgi:hypothetical protein
MFEDIVREESRPADVGKLTFDCLNGSGWSSCKGIRQLLRQWCDDIPSEVQRELRSCFRTKNGRQHVAAFFELYLYELLSKLGFGLEFHPHIEEKGTRPDFKILKDGKPLLYLEATFVALPDGPHGRDSCGSAPHVEIRESIQNRAGLYGKIDLPYVIAVNVIDELGVDDIDIGNALLGEEQLKVVFREKKMIRRSPGRVPNGLWHGPRGPRNRRVSAALIAINLSPWNFAEALPMLWHNPWAAYPLARDIWPLPQLVPDLGND